jgi:tRNA (guanine37-N1)-methyltransferase
MVLKPEPVAACFEDILKNCPNPSINVFMTPCGSTLSHERSVELSQYDCVNILCGHYEGVDQRAIDKYIDLEISVGDYVLTGGELAAMVVTDTVIRHIEGVLGNDESTLNESFSNALLEHPQYTRPAQFEDQSVPEVLLSGHHANVEDYNRRKSLEQTAAKRPEMLSKTVLSKTDIEYLTGQ